jgi:hypothetical protein
MKKRTLIVVSKKWKEPMIEVHISDSEIGACMDFDDLHAALLEELGNPLTILTKERLKARIDSALKNVLKELRENTKYIV